MVWRVVWEEVWEAVCSDSWVWRRSGEEVWGGQGGGSERSGEEVWEVVWEVDLGGRM